MAAAQNFRTAFNGFKREDVVQYIEYLNAKHAAEVNQLTSDNELLRQKLEALQEGASQIPVQTVGEYSEEINDMLAKAASRIQELEQELADMTAQRDAALEEKSTVVKQTMQQCRVEEELEAYRRAERAERVAKERADQLYRKANGVLGEATARVDTISGEVGAMVDQVVAQLEVLKTAVSGSKLALQEAAATLYTISPAEAEE